MDMKLFDSELKVMSVLWREGDMTAKFRYRAKDIPVHVEKIGDEYLVSYEKAKAVTPGQACVFYDGEV